jgi:hypothetical protein
MTDLCVSRLREVSKKGFLNSLFYMCFPLARGQVGKNGFLNFLSICVSRLRESSKKGFLNSLFYMCFPLARGQVGKNGFLNFLSMKRRK